eukprot:Stramenopile-MAST_4_protein_1966
MWRCTRMDISHGSSGGRVFIRTGKVVPRHRSLMSWCTIESDPGVFTELIHSVGCDDVQLEEVITMDMLPEKMYGLIFLFKWKKELYQSDTRMPITAEDTTVYFAKQTVNNACATQALINILLNCDDLELGDTLRSFKEFTSMFPYDMRGEMIGQQEIIREKHNSFAQRDPFVSTEDKSDDDGTGDAHHFVAYVEKSGGVYELDGLKAGPILIGPSSGNGDAETWIDVVKREVQRRVDEFASDETHFNLMAVVPNKLKAARLEYAELNSRSNPSSDDVERLQALDNIIREEEQEKERYTQENKRRRHNYIPFIITAMQSMARKNILMDAYLTGKSKVLEQLAARSKEKMASLASGAMGTVPSSSQ